MYNPLLLPTYCTCLVLLLETAASDANFLELLRKLNMTFLKMVCKEVLLKLSGSKVDVKGRF